MTTINASSFTTSDGTRLTYRTLGQGPAVVFHAGAGATGEWNWIRPGIADAVAGLGRTAVLLDHRGVGGSQVFEDAADLHWSKFVQDVRDLLDHLELQRCDFVGYSLGGMVAIMLAPREERVRSAVLGGIGLSTLSPDIRWELEGYEDQLLALDETGITDPTVLAMRKRWRDNGVNPRVRVAHAKAFHTPWPYEPGKVTVPALVVSGEHDAEPHRLAASMPDARAQVVPGNHLTAVDTPELRDAIVAFLAER